MESTLPSAIQPLLDAYLLVARLASIMVSLIALIGMTDRTRVSFGWDSYGSWISCVVLAPLPRWSAVSLPEDTNWMALRFALLTNVRERGRQARQRISRRRLLRRAQALLAGR